MNSYNTIDQAIISTANLASRGNTVNYFKSTNYPENYPNNHSEVIIPPLVTILFSQNLLKEWKLEVDDGKRINLTFTNFEVEFDPFGDCGFDYVEVSYRNFSEKYCGLSVPGPFISNTTITVKFHSDDFYNETGFSAMWAVVQEGKI